jgi:hypothetical protein
MRAHALTEDGGSASMQYLVARFADGRVVKGTALGLDFAAGTFRMDVNSGPDATGPTEFETAELKALFGVEDLEGDPERADWTEARGPHTCDEAVVRFKDGEKIVGVIPDYDPEADYFYLVPTDPESNNIWCYVRTAATEEVRLIPPDMSVAGRMSTPGVSRALARIFSMTGLTHMRHL